MLGPQVAGAVSVDLGGMALVTRAGFEIKWLLKRLKSLLFLLYGYSLGFERSPPAPAAMPVSAAMPPCHDGVLSPNKHFCKFLLLFQHSNSKVINTDVDLGTQTKISPKFLLRNYSHRYL